MSRKTTTNRITSPTVPINFKPNQLDSERLKSNAGYNLPNTKMEGNFYSPHPRLDGRTVSPGAPRKKA